jgi:hypothetical protein
MFDEHKSVIVLEDDFTTSEHFLRFMNNALRFYEAEDRVVSVCGYSPLGVKTSADTYFLPGTHCWGWAAWRRSWFESEHDPRKVLEELDRRNLIFDFDAAGAEPCTLLLHRAVQEQRDSWVLPWMASAILMDQLCVFPARSLVRNGGLDKSGLPIEWLRILMPPIADYCPELEPIPIHADEQVLRFVRSHLMKLRFGDSRRKMLYNRVMRILPNAVQRSLYSASVRHAIRSFRS